MNLKKLVLMLAAIGGLGTTTLMLGACNTLEGAGEDIEAAGDAIEDEANNE